MAVDLTPGALSKRISGTCDMNPVVQVIDIKSILSRIEVKGDKVENKWIHINSLIIWFFFLAHSHSDIFIIDLEVICSKCDIIGDPKPFTSKKTPSSAISKPPIIDLNSCSQTQSKKRKGQSSDNITAAAKDASMTMEKNKDDDIAACFEKLEKIGWGTEDPLYDTALLLFVEGAEYRKLWLLLKPESCGKWVKNAGSKLGLLG
ncbi:hypothetical protein Tco_0093271 [Tanacetum coccineum]